LSGAADYAQHHYGLQETRYESQDYNDDSRFRSSLSSLIKIKDEKKLVDRRSTIQQAKKRNKSIKVRNRTLVKNSYDRLFKSDVVPNNEMIPAQ
jgi:hypothetical protein